MADKLGSTVNDVITAAETLLRGESLTELQRDDLQQIYNSARSIGATLSAMPGLHELKRESDSLSAISPEMRAELQSIIGFSQMMADHPDMYGAASPSQAQVAQLQTIYEGGNALLWMVDELIDYGKIRAERMQLRRDYFPLEGVIEDTVAEAGQRVTSAYSTQIPQALPDAFGDKLRTRQILAHLLANAGQAAPQGQVQVEAQAGQNGAGREVIAVSVNDTGVGIAPEYYESVFEPFWQRPPAEGPGLGLGLFVALALANLQGGELWFESKPNVGTSFYFTIPARPD